MFSKHNTVKHPQILDLAPNSKTDVSNLSLGLHAIRDRRKPHKLIHHGYGRPAAKVLLIGAGPRVKANFTTALKNLAWPTVMLGVWSRTSAHSMSIAQEHQWPHIEQLSEQVLAQADVIVMSINSSAAPQVVKKIIGSVECERKTLVIDTPVYGGIRHLLKAGLLSAFKNVVIAEDYIQLPQFQLLRQATTHSQLGKIRDIKIEGLGYLYHGLALARSFLDFDDVKSSSLTDSHCIYRLTKGQQISISRRYSNRSGQVTITGTDSCMVYIPSNSELDFNINRLANKNLITEYWQGNRLAGILVKWGDTEVIKAFDTLDGIETESNPFNYFKTLGLITVLNSVFEQNSHSSYDYHEALLDNYISHIANRRYGQLVKNYRLLRLVLEGINVTTKQSAHPGFQTPASS